jgi:ribosome maturation factor RimP
MIEKEAVGQIIDEWLKGKDYFLVSVDISSDDKIVVEIDHKDGVWIEDCADLSRFIESRLNRGMKKIMSWKSVRRASASLLKYLQQYINNIGEEVEVMTLEGKKLTGILKSADAEKFVVSVPTKVKADGEKRPKLVNVDETFAYNEIKYTKYLIRFK